MKLLILTGSLYPRIGNNANLLSKLLLRLREDHEIEILSPAFESAGEALPEQMFGLPVHWAADHRSGLKRKLIYGAVSRFSRDGGYTGTLGADLIAEAAASLRKAFPFQAVLSTMQPYSCALASLKLPNVRRLLYLMDPPYLLLPDMPAKDAQAHMAQILKKQDYIFTTPFIREAFADRGLTSLEKRSVTVCFPHMEAHICRPSADDIPFLPDRIHLLYCGALFPSIRDPACFLKILERLDSRFSVTFMGRNCVQFWQEHAVETSAEVRVFPPLPYQTALNAMEQADVLINIGNNMRVHMPSKTLDYINTGKPILNFHKFPDCPTLYFTQKYPLCLNISEPDFELESGLTQIVDFCTSARGKRVPRSEIEETYEECRPETIANAFLQALNSLEVL